MSVPPDVPSYAPQYTVKQPPKSRPQVPAAREAAPALVQVSTSQVDTRYGDADVLGGITVPDFRGKSLRQVTEESLKTGFRLQSIGSGAAVEQSPLPGSTLPLGGRVQVRFSSRVGGE
jgi:hypothetical protein